jgi:hypothetical protein
LEYANFRVRGIKKKCKKVRRFSKKEQAITDRKNAAEMQNMALL